MPGSVPIASPTTVLPQMLSKAFTVDVEYLAAQNSYANGEAQLSVFADAPNRTWALTNRLLPTEIATLQAFYIARNGGHQAFIFYDSYESNFVYDSTGAATGGRHFVVFEGALTRTGDVGRSDVQLKLREIS